LFCPPPILGIKSKKTADGDFGHSTVFTVLNRAGEIRHQQTGWGADPGALAKAVAEAR
jgi:hypothetical protein